MIIDAVVLAGGEASKVDPSLSGPKSLIDICGRPMISYVMDALNGCDDLRQVVIALPEGAERAKFENMADVVVEKTTGVINAITKSIHAVGENGYVLVVSSDTPMMRSEAINDFLNSCRQEKAEVYYSIIPREATESVFPDTRRTYLRLKDGTFTGGNVHLVEKDAFLRNADLADRMFSLRKNPISILGLLGLGFVIKYITGRLDVKTLENKGTQLLGAEVKAIITAYPELGVDVDKPEDLKLAAARLGNQ